MRSGVTGVRRTLLVRFTFVCRPAGSHWLEKGTQYACGRSKDVIEVEGTVAQALPNTMFAVDLENGHSVLADISGKLRNELHSGPSRGQGAGASCRPYDLKRGRITYRLK